MSPSSPLLTLIPALLLVLPQTSTAQALPTAAFAAESTSSGAATSNGAGPAGIVPYNRGVNASLGITSQHDSSNGWSTLLTPGVALRVNKVFSLDAAVPIYAHINVESNRGSKNKPVFQLVTETGVPGDTSISAHASAHTFLDNTATFTLGLPTGNSDLGLSAGRVTYSLNNRAEKSFGILTPDLELGIADTSSLTNRRFRRSYTSVGAIAHIQVGSSVDLPRNLSLSVDAFEDLPLVRGILYSTAGHGRKKSTTATNAPSAEDNGVNTSLDLPVSRHLTLSGLYSRSFRAHDDVAGLSLTFLLRAPPRSYIPQ